MAPYELNASIARHLVKKGDPPRNPLGLNTPSNWHRPRSFEIKAALRAELKESCEVPGFEHLTKFEYGIRNIVGRFQEGDKWAVTFVTNRLFGRVPFDVSASVAVSTAQDDLTSLSDDQLRARLDRLRTVLLPPVDVESADPAMDAVLIEDDPATPEGPCPVGDKPNEP